MMYTYMLSACINAKDVARAAGLWTQMQEEDVQASPEFLQKLGKFLESQNQPVPFTIPDVLEKVTTSAASTSPVIQKNLNVTKAQQDVSETRSPQNREFSAAIKNGDINAAVELKKK